MRTLDSEERLTATVTAHSGSPAVCPCAAVCRCSIMDLERKRNSGLTQWINGINLVCSSTLACMTPEPINLEKVERSRRRKRDRILFLAWSGSQL